MTIAKTDSKSTVTLKAREGEPQERALARLALTPAVRASAIVRAAIKPTVGDVAVTDLMEELALQTQCVRNGDLSRLEEMLAAQAVTLDALFHDLARRALLNAGEYMNAFEVYMRLAIKAQAQCRATIEGLNGIKNPTPVHVVRQANIGQNVQVNNGPTPEKSETERNELLRGQHGERLDNRAALPASGADTAVATVGKVHGAEVVGRQGAISPQRLQRGLSGHTADPASAPE